MVKLLRAAVLLSVWVSANSDPSCISSGVNRAFMFVKPNAAYAPKAVSLVRSKLSEVGIAIVEEGLLEANAIEENNLIDKHYGAIASKAMRLKPRDLAVSPEAAKKFRDAFQAEFPAAVSAGRVFNAKDACAELRISEAELGERWAALTTGKDLVKFGGGFYCGAIERGGSEGGGEDTIFVINGFYMAMRAMYIEKGASIVWMCVEWPEEKMR